ncbi:MAG: FmdB family zinc ribbon protein [Actinomycetota bacterium]
MPTYDYRCERTGEMFEQWQSFSDDALETCPLPHCTDDEVCGAPVKKVFSKVGISFKGDGFYKNDHGSTSGGRAAESSASSSESSTSDSSSSDSGGSTSSGSDSSSSSSSD